MTGYAVLLKDARSQPLAPLAFMTGRLGSKAEAESFLRQHPAFLGRNLTLEAAQALAAMAELEELQTVIAAEADMPVLPPPLKGSPVKITPAGAGFYAEAAGARNFVPYESVTLISAGAFDANLPPVTIEPLRRDVFEEIKKLAGIPVPPPQTMPAVKETFFRADILAENGELRFLLEPENLDYSGLGQARAPSSFVNFRTLLLSRSAFKAVKNPFLEVFLAGKPAAPFKLASARACETETARLLLLSTRTSR
jgi:hypothetical protein